ncbi:RINT-1 / TIP-1 family protein [Ancylostoma caninum]|uniref:RINT-1 / TIP-1 family protein n=1 Tax=Ancylostoma caninum TaxID=29170 RepID=A0A368GIQ8_ANCCA|nr:RINT-1 / TIP-1 family protein [Ancylostoma caninum]
MSRDHSMDDGDSSSESNGQPNPAELSKTALALRNQLEALPANNALEFLANVRKVAREIDIEANVVSEELAVLEESYPQILATLQGFKRDLLLMREEVCMLRSRYESFVKSFLKLVEKNCPELIPQLQALSRKQVQLKRLKWVNRGRDLLSSCRTLMKDTRCDWTKLTENFRNACLHAQEHVELTDNSRVTFIDGLNSLAPELNEFARKRAKEILDIIKYPFEDSIDTRAFTDEASTIANILSLIYSIAEHTKGGTGYDEICRVLLDPIGIRFAFHFYGDRKTNDVTKPQWYLSQTLNWIQVNMPFFETVQGMVIKEHNLSKSPASVFLKYLSELSISKTKTLLKQEKVLEDVLLFSHLIDECISYETQLHDMDPDGYASNILSLFCERTVLSRWIEIENECCLDRMDEMLSAPDRWQNRFRSMEDADEFLVCNCADSFVSMLQSQQNRVRLLPDDLAQRRFLDLQLLLTDDFRKRLAQIARQSESPWSEPFPNVMNAIWLHSRHVWNQMAEDVVTSLRVQTTDVIKPYQQHFWCVMEPRLGNTSRDITDIFCPVLMKVRTTFANTGAQISKDSLEELFKRMSSALATVILEEIVDVTPFSAEGATQMLFDMENGLIPILSHIFSRCGVAPNMYYDEAFITLLGSLKLLSLSWAVITLLKDEIDQLPEEVADEKLFEMKIYGVNKERAKNLIRLRSDIEKGMDELR